MSCSLHAATLSRGQEVKVNGVPIARDIISRETQQHPSRTPMQAWTAAARALVVRELLLQEARRLDIVAKPIEDSNGRRESDEEAAIRALVDSKVRVPEADVESCRRFYDKNRNRFRSSDIYEAAHILFAAAKSDAVAYEQTRTTADTVLAALRDQPDRFTEFAKSYSTCPSAAQGGNLGQITAGQTTPEFERALAKLERGDFSRDPVATRYGFHIIRLDRKHAGRELPFELVADWIAEHLNDSVRRRATAQYLGRLAGAARIEGIDLPSAEMLRVN